jgi:parvulin-like peptidyl-prolyl isomerase
VVEPANLLDIKLTRAEVERYYREHLDKYSAPELSRIRHILVEPADASPQADQAARREAEELLARIRKGEKFADLARRYSDDLATREQGGDVGVFRRGMMLDEFERVAFSMRLGDLRGPIRTPAGWHLMECLEYVPQETAPLKYAYPNAAGDLADERASEIARQRADSLYRIIKTPAQGRAIAKKAGFTLLSNEHVIGTPIHVRDLQSYFQRLEQVPANTVYPGIQQYKGMGWVVTWVDSVAPERVPTWERARDQALDLVRRSGSLRKLNAKRAELDSLARAGWSLDSLGALWGGLQRLERVSPGAAIPRLGGRREIDSLAFGVAGKPPALKPGEATAGWIALANGQARIRLDERFEPDPVEMANAIENERRLGLERNLQEEFARLQKRYPVKILDAELRATALPALPDS